MKLFGVVALVAASAGTANAAEMVNDACWTSFATASTIECQDQALTGFTPPADIAGMDPDSMTSIKIYKNDLSGFVPTELGTLTKLKVYTDYRNKISGFLPTEIGLVTTFTEINIYKNKVSGTIPTEAGGLWTGGPASSYPPERIDWNNFVIMNNKFSGCIPLELTVCSDDLPNNSVNGYCSMSTQGTPGINSNCGTLAPTTAAPTTGAPTSCSLPVKYNEFDGLRRQSCNTKRPFKAKRFQRKFFTASYASKICPYNRWVWTTTPCKQNGKRGFVVVKATSHVRQNPGSFAGVRPRNLYKRRCYTKFQRASFYDMCN